MARKEKKNAHRGTNNLRRMSAASSDGDEQVNAYKISAGLMVLLFAMYSYTTYPSIAGGDSGELVTAACEGGVAHPPGYPLWTLLSSLAIKLLPFNAAYSVNLLTCLTASIASATLFLVCQRLTGSVTASAIATVVFSLSPLTWTWSVTAEVFALNNLFISLLILLLLRFELAESERDRKQTVYLGAFFSALALTNQHTVIIYLPALVLRVLYKLVKLTELSKTMVISTIGLGCLGLSPYCYLFISSYKNTARWSWGEQTSLRGFLTHFLREEYGSFQLGNVDGAHPGFVANLVKYKKSLLYELTEVGYALACLGIVQVFIDGQEGVRRTSQTLLVMLITYITFFCWRANLDITSALMKDVVERFWLQTNIIWTVLMSMGCKLLYVRLNLKASIPLVVKSSVFAGVLALCLRRGWEQCNHRTDSVVHDFAQSIFSSLPNNSLVLTKGDLPSATLRYLQFCEGEREDVTLVEQELMSYNWYIPKIGPLLRAVNFPGNRWHNILGTTFDGAKTFNMLKFLDANAAAGQRLIFVCIGMQTRDNSWTSKYQLMPFGCCHQVVSSEGTWVDQTHPYVDHWATSYAKLREGSWENVANEEMWNAKISKALFLYESATRTADTNSMYQLYSQSHQAYSQVLNSHSTVPDYFHKNYALACEKVARTPRLPSHTVKQYLTEALRQFELYSRSGADDPQMSAIVQVMESLKGQLS